MANLATLSVGLLLNSAEFKTSLFKAYDSAGRESGRFARKVQDDAKKAERAYLTVGKAISGLAGKLALIGGTGLSLGGIISTTRQYGQALSDLSAITGATGAQLKQFDDAAQHMGRTTEYSASQAATALKLMASAKPELMKTSDGLIKATNSALILAQAGGTTLPDATRTLALSLNQFGASAAEADRYINVLAAGAKYGSSEITDTAAAIKNGGVAAAQAKVSFEELNAAIQVLAEREVKGGEAGTALRNVILHLEKGTDKTLKPSVVGLSTALENLSKKNLSTKEAVKLFGLENINAASILVQSKTKLDELTVALTGTRTAYDQAAIRVNNLNGDLLSLSSAFEGMAIKIGQSTDGPLRSGVKAATEAVNSLSDNFNAVANIALYTLIPAMGTKLTAGLRENISAWRGTEKATRSAAKQQAEIARQTIDAARAMRDQAGEQARWLATQSVINRQNGINVSYQKEHVALSRQIREANLSEAAAKNKLAAANRQLSFSTRALSVSAGLASGALSLLGGPFGAAMLAGSALVYLYNRSVESRKEILNLKDATIETVEVLQQLSKVKIELKMDGWQNDLENIKKEKNQLESQLGRYSDTRINISKSRREGVLGFLYDDPKRLEKEKKQIESKLEDLKTAEQKINENIANGKKVLAGGKFEVKPQETKPQEEKPASPWTGNGSNAGGSKRQQTLSQYQQLRREIESAHADSLTRIGTSENETHQKILALAKKAGASQSEVSKLLVLNEENYQRERMALAEKYAPAKAIIRQESDASKELKAIFDARLLTEREYLAARLALNQEATKERLAEQAKAASAPHIDIIGEVDPIIQLQNQLEQQKALYTAYYEDGIISKERYEQLVTSATNKSKESQLTAAKELYASQGSFQKMQMNLLDAVEQRTGNALTGMLMGTKSFSDSLKELTASLAQSIIQDLIRIAMQAVITNAVSGLFGGFSGAGGGVTKANGQLVPMPPKLNAKGGVYSSPSLSTYSGQIVSSPTLFAFAKGATGLMGEAGPEAILPLKRGPDGSLGVRASSHNNNTQAVSAAPQVFIQIDGNGNASSQAPAGLEAFGSQIATFVDSRYRELRDRDLRPGGPLWRR
ncbi:phage tail tape measure protein [Photorhabdus luminescens]|uniref:phage tail tape measure protein n=1 Tax=Photorhabdus luminescens TaxID=29488 RepID=UPI000B4DC319|nr:phage tail tape measure protein [Photorhabdus luminescens]OWO86535.1 phage tail tape measure protein [Photorhabdus luminescens]